LCRRTTGAMRRAGEKALTRTTRRYGRSARRRGRAARRNLHADQFRLRCERLVRPLRSAQCPALRTRQVLPGDRDGHLALVDDLDRAACQRRPVVIDGRILARGRDRYLISAETPRINVRRRDVGGRMRCVVGRVRASGRKYTYGAQDRSACSLAYAMQINHPLATIPAAGGSAGLADRALLFWRAGITDFLPADGIGSGWS
jgi:hypothetical protein